VPIDVKTLTVNVYLDIITARKGEQAPSSTLRA
jgi:hypothetical protein